MRPAEEVRRDLVRQWLTKAEEDIQVARLLMKKRGSFRSSVAFHAQQAAEKYLKAALVNYEVVFPTTHSIQALLDLLAKVKAGVAQSLSHAGLLTPYGVGVRYPGDTIAVTEPEAILAVKAAGDVRRAVRKLLHSLSVARPRRPA